MSGVKCDPAITIRQSQWNAMNNQCRQAQDAAARERIEREKQVAAAQQDAQRRMLELQSQVNSQIVGLSQEMREIERKQNEAFSNALEQQGAEIRREMQQQRTELTEMINAVQQRIDNKELGQKERAGFWAEQANAYVNEIDSYRHNLFAPGSLDRIRRLLQQMQSEIDAQSYASAIPLAINAFNEAIELRAEVIAASIEWENAFRALSERVAYINSCINDAKLLEFTVGAETVPAKVDFWTNGALSALESEFAQFQQMVQNSSSITTNDLVRACTALDNMRDQSFPISNKEGVVVGGIINEAKQRLLLSAFRADMANDIAAAMHKQGWRIEDSGYKGGDQRDELHIKIVDGTGNEMVAIVAPGVAQGGSLINSLRLDFFNDKQANLDVTEIAVKEVGRVLRESGIETNMRCAEGFENRHSDSMNVRDIKQTIAVKNGG